MLDTALYWLNRGIAAIPLYYRTKKPVIKWGQYRHTLPTDQDIKRWFNGTPRNIALITGWQGLTILEFDCMRYYGDWLCWQQQYNPGILDTYQVLSSKGIHLYYYVSRPFNKIKPITDRLEIKSHGSLCNAVPSVHPSGSAYTPIGHPDNIRSIEYISSVLLHSPVEFSRPAVKLEYDPWAPQTTDSFERVDLLDLFPNAQPTHNKQYWLADCPFHGHKQNFMLNVKDGICYCFAGCGTFKASEIVGIIS